MSDQEHEDFYNFTYYKNLWIYVKSERKVQLFQLIGINFILGLLPIIIISFISFKFDLNDRLSFYGDAGVVIFSTTLLIPTIFKLFNITDQSSKSFKTTMMFFVMLFYTIGIVVFLQYQQNLERDWDDFKALIVISIIFLLATFLIISYVHFTEKIDYKNDVEKYIQEKEQDEIAKKAKEKKETNSGEIL